MRYGVVPALLAVLISGCHRRAAQEPEGAKAGSQPEEPVPLKELPDGQQGEPINWEAPLQESGYWGSIGPLQFASQLSLTGDFDCIAFAANPLRLVSFQASRQAATLSEVMEAAAKEFKPLEIERHPDWALLHFGTPQELKGLKATTEGELPPVMVSAGTPGGLLRMIASVWSLDLRIEPGVVRRRNALLEEQQRKLEEEPYGTRPGGRYYPSQWAYYGPGPPEPFYYGYGPHGYGASQTTPRLGFTIAKKTSLEEVMERAAVTLGGEAERQGGAWFIRRQVDGRQLSGEVDRLMADLLNEEESPAESDAAQGLIVVGEAAVPRLVKALDPQQPEVAAKAALVLGELKAKEAGPAIVKLWREVPQAHPTSPEDRGTMVRLLLLEAMGKLGGPEVVALLVETATARDQPAEMSLGAREALVELGALEALPMSLEPTIESPDKRYRFALRRPAKKSPGPSGGQPAPDSLVIDAECQDDTGRHWALFRASALGSPGDVWLATSPDGQTWQEFLFTGLQDPSTLALQYGYGREAGKYGLTAAKGVLTVTLPASRYPPAPHVPTTRQLKEADLRQDTDGDGLTEPVEKRLGTSPTQADTDGDSVPDGTDGNPLVGPSETPTDREAVLQQLFAYLFGGSAATDVVVVSAKEDPHQEFHGYAGPVIAASRRMLSKRQGELGRADRLWVGGTVLAEDTILTLDGPVGFNDSRSKAEVQFRLIQEPSYERYSPYGSAMGAERTALFAKTETGWALTRVAGP